MSKFITILLAVFLSASTYSQKGSTDEIIAAGSAKMKVTPDIATFTLTVEKSDTAEKSAISALNRTVDDLTRSINKIGFRNEQIRIAGYEVSSAENEEHIKVYKASNTLKINFLIDNILINAFYREIQQANMKDLDVSFETSLSKNLERAIHQKLVQEAIREAKSNAENISRTLGTRLGKVKQVHKHDEALPQNIDLEMVKFSPPVVKQDNETRYHTAFEKFQVEEVDLEERITVVFEISN